MVGKIDTKRKKPKFLRTDWHKKIRLGRGVKKNQKWHGAKGRQNKLRLNRKGRMQRPKIGWGADTKNKGFVGRQLCRCFMAVIGGERSGI